MEKVLFTSESVSEGHPDKLCDQISDAILDACLAIDPEARVACECYITDEYVLVGGEVTARQHPNYLYIVRDVLKRVGYTSHEIGIGNESCIVDIRLREQSPDISMGINHGELYLQGAGDQGMMFGYASDESDGYMPLPIVIAHKLVRLGSLLRKNGHFEYARPDMKAQVTIDYTDPQALRIDTILMSVQHEPKYDEVEFKKFIHDNIMVPVVQSFGLNEDFNYLINPTGKFVIGGPAADTGLTGRKIIVDTYGGSARHGGGAFSGKDPSKVDRSGAYMARYIAKNLVAAGVAQRIEVQLAYAIGIAEPISIGIQTFDTALYDDDQILKCIKDCFDCRPGAIIDQFNLTSPTFYYEDLACYGHFGRPDLDLPWEKLDKVKKIKKFFDTDW
ncbi:MAG: methionine adenosyltransferase [Bacilli bacterium]|nr:methionine adenosyltransferase [Bacilli bacterium]